MNNDIAISVKNVSKTFKIPHEKISSLRGAVTGAFKKGGFEEFKALDDVSFEVKKGEFFGIIGRNGSGKSTLLKILAGIYQTDSGSISIDGRISPFLELGIGFNPELSGRDNVYLNATVLGLTKKEIDEKFDSIVAFSELERFIDQKLKNYSSGMQVRLAFSVSIHANREILLMDEVLAVGDSNFQSKCLEEFNKYKEMGKTVILVSHDIATVQRYCDRAMLVRNGKIVKIGKADEVGDAYIYENMSDEEDRMAGNESSIKVINHEKIDKAAEIIKVEFLNKDEIKKSVFNSGDDIVIRIYYESKIDIKNPVFGVALYMQDGIMLFGPNTKTSKVKLDSICGNGFVDFIIIENIFIKGIYRVTVSIYDWKCIIPIEFKDMSYTFSVVSDNDNWNGLINLKHKWNV